MPLVSSLSEVGTNIRELYGPRIKKVLNTFAAAGDMALGKRPIDPVVAAEATLIGQMSPVGGPKGAIQAGLSPIRKDMLKRAGKEIKRELYVGGASEDAIVNTMKGIQGMPEMLLKKINKLEFKKLPRGAADANPHFRRVRFDSYNNTPDSPIHEGTHLQQFIPSTKTLGLADADDKRALYRTYLQSNIKNRIFRGVAKHENNPKSTPKQRRLALQFQNSQLYTKHPWELGARGVARHSKKFYGFSDLKDEGKLNRQYLDIYNKETDRVLRKLREDAPKLYQKATRDTNKQMKMVYGKDWLQGLPMKRVKPST